MLVEGQVEGGISMGVGFALQEEMLFDATGARSIRISRTTSCRHRSTCRTSMSTSSTSYDPSGPFGAKGVGEPTSVPTAAAILNGVYNAVGVRITSLPATPEKVLAALRQRTLSRVD